MANRTAFLRPEERRLHEIVLSLWLEGKGAKQIAQTVRKQQRTDPELLQEVISSYPIPSAQVLKSIREDKSRLTLGFQLLQAISSFLFGTKRMTAAN
jgi:hypothetical protein